GAARAHLARHREAYGVSPEALASARPIRTIAVRSGVTVTTMRQFVDGIPVLGSDASVLLRADRSLVAIAGAPHAAARSGLRRAFPLSAAEAAVAAADDL